MYRQRNSIINEANLDNDNRGFETAVTSQPAQVPQYVAKSPDERTWIPSPTVHAPNCPPGLESLTITNQLIVHKLQNKVPVLDRFGRFPKFEITNSMQQSCFFAVEGAQCLCS